MSTPERRLLRTEPVVTTELLVKSGAGLVVHLRKLRSVFEDKPTDEVTSELLTVRDSLDKWVKALLAHDEHSALQSVTDLRETQNLGGHILPVKRKNSSPEQLESHVLRTCFEKDFVSPKLNCDISKPVVVLGPLSTGAMMSAIVASTMSRLGYNVSWLPVYVPVNKENFSLTVIPVDEIDILRQLMIVDDGYSNPLNNNETNPLRTVGAVWTKIEELKNLM